MKRLLHTLALFIAWLALNAHADPATSANYAIATSLDGGGRVVTSQNYEHTVIITPLSGRSVATFSVAMLIGFASQLNTGPIAEDDVRSHPQDTAVTISATSLFANDIDPDGDPLTLVSVDAMSAQGGALTVNGQTITYTPPPGLTGSDQFDYIVADANGDIASATVILGIAPPYAGQLNNTVIIAKQSDGQYLIRFRQHIGFTEYIIQFKHDLNDPNWQTLKNVRAGSDGVVEALFHPSVADQTFFRALVR